MNGSASDEGALHERGAPPSPSSPPDASSARERLGRFFARRVNRHGWVARRELGQPSPGDDQLRQQLATSAGSTFRQGSGAYSWALRTGLVEDLAALAPGSEQLREAVAPLLTLSGRAGAFGEGCTSARHGHRVCEHFIGGFFAVAPPSARVAPTTLPNGRAYRVESQARFAASCWILRAVLLAGAQDDAGVQRHLSSFGYLLEEWDRWEDFLVPDLAFAALGALAIAPERWRDTRESLLKVVSGRQLRDGTWPKVDFFTALDGLMAVDHPTARELLARALPSLLQRQREDGSFGTVAPDERGLIGLRVLARVIG